MQVAGLVGQAHFLQHVGEKAVGRDVGGGEFDGVAQGESGILPLLLARQSEAEIDVGHRAVEFEVDGFERAFDAGFVVVAVQLAARHDGPGRGVTGIALEDFAGHRLGFVPAAQFEQGAGELLAQPAEGRGAPAHFLEEGEGPLVVVLLVGDVGADEGDGVGILEPLE